VDHIACNLVQVSDGPGRPFTGVALLVNGRPLEELARVVERPYAVAENQPDLAGDYEPLALADIGSDRTHFLGQPVATWFEDGDTVLMGCPCGEWACWPLTVRVEVTEQTVRWHGFRTGHRDWDLSGLGPFVFDRPQYEAALEVIG
jgi:hypothetical protein